MSFRNVGKVWSVKSLEEYLKTLTPPSYAKSVTLHHTWAPSLAQRPSGLLIQHIHNMQDYYQNTLGWSSGPHLFVDENEIFGMTPLNEKSVHAISFNANSISIEVLGNYDSEDPFKNRGEECWKVASDVTMVLLNWLNLTPSSNTIHFHRDDPKTSKSCPGTKIEKTWFVNMVKSKGFNKATEPVVVPETDIVSDYVIKNKGYNHSDVAKLLKKKAGMFYFGEDWLEGAYYDSKKESTVAPISELSQIANKK